MVTIYQNPSKANAGSDIVTCLDSTNLNALAPTKGIGKWICDKGAINNSNKKDAVLSGLAINQAVACIWTVENGICPVSDDTVIINRLPQLTEPNIYFEDTLVNKDSITICITNGAVLKGELPNPTRKEITTWSSTGNAVTPVQGNNPVFGAINALAIGTNKISYTISSPIIGCETKMNTFTIAVKGPTDAIVYPIKDTCELADTVMIETAPLNKGEEGTWLGSKKPTKSLKKDQWFIHGDEIKPGTTTYTWEVTNFVCPPDKDSKVLTILPGNKPKIELNPVDTVCQETAIQALAQTKNVGSAARYIWKLDTINLGTTLTPKLAIDKLEKDSKLIVTLEVNDVCSFDKQVSDTIQLVAIRKPSPYIITPKVDICSDSMVNLIGGDLEPKRVPTTYSWRKDMKNLAATDSTLKNISQAGKYYYLAKNKFCVTEQSSLALDVKVTQKPEVHAYAHGINPIIGGLSDHLKLSGYASKGATAKWTTKTTGNLIIDPLDMHSDINTISFSGNHRAFLEASNGNCKSKDSVDIVIKVGCHIQAPNAFTLNGDGINETFRIKGIENCPDAVVTIFNRWGHNIYKTHNYHLHEWDGKNYPEGTYYYVVKFDKKQERGEGHSGVIHLIK